MKQPDKKTLFETKVKTEGDEFLDRMNHSLALEESKQYVRVDQPVPTVFIVGAPRSGTTLVNQVLASCFDFGYVNQLIASMWLAPVTGLRLSRKLLPKQLKSDFLSNYAITSNITEPHEFGYFWSKHLGYENMMAPCPEEIEKVDWATLRNVIQNLSLVAGRSYLFKPLMLVWYLEALFEHCPESLVVWVDRDPLQTVMSILQMRLDIHGDMKTWHSLKPADFESLSNLHPYEQVKGQVRSIKHALAASHSKHPRQMIKIPYEEFCLNTDVTLDSIENFFFTADAKIERVAPAPTLNLSKRSPEEFEESEYLMSLFQNG